MWVLRKDNPFKEDQPQISSQFRKHIILDKRVRSRRMRLFYNRTSLENCKFKRNYVMYIKNENHNFHLNNGNFLLHD